MMPEPVTTNASTTQLATVSMKMEEQVKNPVTTISASSVEAAGVCAPTPQITVYTSSPASSRSKDSSWLKIEVCREYLKDGCPRGDQCRFAHPDKSISTEEGKVTCCYDFLKDRCHREHCKYFHPPPHIKERLVTAGKQFGAMMSGMYAVPIPPGAVPSAALPVSSPVPPLVGYEGGCVLASPAPVLSPYGMPTEKLHICPEYLRGQCHLQMCAFAHPEHYVRRNPDLTVTVCRDFIRSSGCPREQCRYFHPPPHISVQLETSASSWPAGLVTPQGVFVQTLLPQPGFQQAGPVMYQAPAPTLQPFPLATSTSTGIPTSISIPTSNFVFPGTFRQTGSAFYPAGYPGGLSGFSMMSSQGVPMFSHHISPRIATSLSFPTPTVFQSQSIPRGVRVIESPIPTTPPLTFQPVPVSDVQPLTPQNIISSHPIQH